MAGKIEYQDRDGDLESAPESLYESKGQRTSHPLPNLGQSQMTNVNLTTKLVTESFDSPPTAASDTLKQAAIAYHRGEMIKIANLFLKCWRILHIEYTNFLAGQGRLLPCRVPLPSGQYKILPAYNIPTNYKLNHKDIVRECQARVQMGHCVLADLALVCLYCTGEYKRVGGDGYYSYTLDRFGISDKDYGHTTTEELEIDGKIWPRESRVYRMFRLVDDIGYKISKSQGFA